MIRQWASLGLAGLLASVGVAAQEREASYSSPYLVTAPDAGAERIRRLETGERVDVTREQGRWVRVRTQSGESGWVRESQLRP